MNTQSLAADRPHFVRLDGNQATSTTTASRLSSITNCCESVKTACSPMAKTCGLLTAGFAAGGVMGSLIAGGLMEYDLNSHRFNGTAEVRMWAKAGAGMSGFLVGGMLGMTTVAIHRGVNMINKALQGYQSVAREEPVGSEDAFSNPVFVGSQAVNEAEVTNQSA